MRLSLRLRNEKAKAALILKITVAIDPLLYYCIVERNIFVS